ncbi:MAG: hypothetical protein QXI10_03575 [Candidatus Diapherotrites archaeon]
MPFVKNERYLPLVESKKYPERNKNWESFKGMTSEEFKEKLEKIHYNQKQKTIQAKLISILLYYTGLRPTEILRITGGQITKGESGIKIPITSAKKGQAGIVLLPKNEYTLQLYEHSNKIPPEMPIFYYFAKNQENKVKWKKKITNEEKTKTYIRNQNLHYFCMKWFGVPPYFFRHNRLSRAAEKGATLEELREMKLAKKIESVLPYLKWSITTKKRLKKYYLD